MLRRLLGSPCPTTSTTSSPCKTCLMVTLTYSTNVIVICPPTLPAERLQDGSPLLSLAPLHHQHQHQTCSCTKLHVRTPGQSLTGSSAQPTSIMYLGKSLATLARHMHNPSASQQNVTATNIFALTRHETDKEAFCHKKATNLAGTVNAAAKLCVSSPGQDLGHFPAWFPRLKRL